MTLYLLQLVITCQQWVTVGGRTCPLGESYTLFFNTAGTFHHKLDKKWELLHGSHNKAQMRGKMNK